MNMELQNKAALSERGWMGRPLQPLSCAEGPDITGSVKPALPADIMVTIPAAVPRDLAENLTTETVPAAKEALQALLIESVRQIMNMSSAR